MIILGLDWGRRRIGIAFASRKIASPLKTLKVRDRDDALEQIANLVSKLEAERIVLGVPLDSEGKETAQSKEIRDFGNTLKQEVDAEVVFWNEALTSKQALRGKIESGQGQASRKDLDATAAAYVLQNYLDSHSAV